MKSLLLENYTDEAIQKMSREMIKNKLEYGIIIKNVVKEIMKRRSDTDLRYTQQQNFVGQPTPCCREQR